MHCQKFQHNKRNNRWSTHQQTYRPTNVIL